MSKFPTLVVSLITLAYPLAVYLALGRVEPYWMALALVGLVLVRAWAARDRVWLWSGAGAVLLALVSLLGSSWMPLKLYPVLVNAVLLTVFSASLWHPPSMVERLARLTEPDLPAAAVPYTRQVTVVWCGFFVLNGLLALATALWASTEVWALYNGLLAYGAMACLFAGEWLVRRRVRASIARTMGTVAVPVVKDVHHA